MNIVDIDIDEEHPEKFGRIRQGKIVAEGLLQEVVVGKRMHPGVGKRSFQECGIHKGFINKSNVLCILDEFVESAEPLYRCWCLRIGSFDSYSRDGDLFLLLEQVEDRGNNFRRVGFAETDLWKNVTEQPADSGLLEFGKLSRNTLI